jgi:hypothetical protein
MNSENVGNGLTPNFAQPDTPMPDIMPDANDDGIPF